MVTNVVPHVSQSWCWSQFPIMVTMVTSVVPHVSQYWCWSQFPIMLTMVTSVVPHVNQSWCWSQFPIMWTKRTKEGMFQPKEDMFWPKEECSHRKKECYNQCSSPCKINLEDGHSSPKFFPPKCVPHIADMEPYPIFPPKLVPHEPCSPNFCIQGTYVPHWFPINFSVSYWHFGITPQVMAKVVIFTPIWNPSAHNYIKGGLKKVSIINL